MCSLYRGNEAAEGQEVAQLSQALLEVTQMVSDDALSLEEVCIVCCTLYVLLHFCTMPYMQFVVVLLRSIATLQQMTCSIVL